MNPKTGRTITAWSPSRLADYELCPAKVKYKCIDKLPDPGGPALERGQQIHEAAEFYIGGRVAKLHPDLSKVKSLLSTLRKDFKKNIVRTEMEIAFDSTWKLVSWFAKEAWCRCKVDVLWLRKGVPALVIDWKTGKYKPDGEYDDQLNIYAVAILTALQDVEAATGQLVFTDHGPEPVERPAGRLVRAGLVKAQKTWEKRTKAMLSDTRFAPTPNHSCKWCPYSKGKGGPCQY